MWVRHTVRNVGPPYLTFAFPLAPPPVSLCNRSFQSYQNPVKVGVDSSVNVAFRATKIPTTLRADVPVAITATKNLEGTMLPVNYRS